ncbi:MAG: SGNH/GDSL hydrolase family protein [Clostridiales bacterium]|nr:SGNH/GDSL hydrolase family protein [Clostridiales bacterium]
MSQNSAPRISILGDGTCSFGGVSLPRGIAAAYLYSERYLSYSGFNTVEGTWWHQLAEKMGGSVLISNGVLGSYVSIKGLYAACLNGRIRSLATEEASPDLVLIYTGMTDVANDIPLDAFQRDYAEMLTKVKKFHPDAQIWCGTLFLGQPPAPNHMYYFEPETLTNAEEYNQVIRDCVKEAGVNLADFAAQGFTCSTVDGHHPDKEGMTAFADAWLKNIKGE